MSTSDTQAVCPFCGQLWALDATQVAEVYPQGHIVTETRTCPSCHDYYVAPYEGNEGGSDA